MTGDGPRCDFGHRSSTHRLPNGTLGSSSQVFGTRVGRGGPWTAKVEHVPMGRLPTPPVLVATHRDPLVFRPVVSGAGPTQPRGPPLGSRRLPLSRPIPSPIIRSPRSPVGFRLAPPVGWSGGATDQLAPVSWAGPALSRSRRSGGTGRSAEPRPARHPARRPSRDVRPGAGLAAARTRSGSPTAARSR